MSQLTYSIISLECSGYLSQPISNRFLRQEGDTDKLAVLYPGLRYTCDMPLLYYISNVLLAGQADVLQLLNNYSEPAYQSSPPANRAVWLQADGDALLQASLRQRNYRKLILLGKSLGTLTMALLINHGHVKTPAVTIWFTPLLHLLPVVQAAGRLPGPALFIGSSQDATYDQNALTQIHRTADVQTMLIEGANHSLEIPGAPLRSLEVLQQIVRTVVGFLDQSGLKSG